MAASLCRERDQRKRKRSRLSPKVKCFVIFGENEFCDNVLYNIRELDCIMFYDMLRVSLDVLCTVHGLDVKWLPTDMPMRL